MATMVSFSNLPTEKTFRRLLSSTEKLVDEKSMEDWKLDQFVKALTNMLTDMRKSMNRPSSKQLDEYKRRIDSLRGNIDQTKLDEQTFPRRVLRELPTNIPIQEQQTETIRAAVPSSTQVEKSENTSTKSHRVHLNRQQQFIQSEEEKQDEIVSSMSTTTKALLTNAGTLQDLLKKDRYKLTEAGDLIGRNASLLSVQSKRLKQNAYNASNCWIYCMLIIVIITFICLTLFMRMFRKPIPTSYPTAASKSTLFNPSSNQTDINDSNITTTKSTDYISLLLNYANDNHTDL